MKQSFLLFDPPAGGFSGLNRIRELTHVAPHTKYFHF